MSTNATVLAVLLLAVPVLGSAQSMTAVKVARMAAVLEQPLGDTNTVGTVGASEVLDEREGWYCVRSPNGPAFHEWRTGWVSRETVEADGTRLHTSARPDTLGRSDQTQAPNEPTANRKGFIVGIGAGAGLHRAPGITVRDRSGRLISSRGGINNFAVVTDFKIGYAPSDQVLIYYSNKAAFTSDSRYDVVGITGAGVTYMRKRTSPSIFFTGSIGAGIGGNISQGSNSESGAGFSVGGGYEFRRHLSLAGDAIFVRLGNGQNHTVFKASFNYLFY